MRTANAVTNESGKTGFVSDVLTIGTAGHGVHVNEFNDVKLYPVHPQAQRMSTAQIWTNAKVVLDGLGFPIIGIKRLSDIKYPEKIKPKDECLLKTPKQVCLEGTSGKHDIRIFVSTSNTRYAIKEGNKWLMFRSPVMLKRKLKGG